MSKYISLLMLFALLLFFVGCEKIEMEDFTKRNCVVYDNVDTGIRKGLVVISAEDIPQTDLAEVVVEHKDNPYNRFKLITSRSSNIKKGDPVDVVTVCYYINSDGVPGTWRKIFAVKK